LFRVQVWMRGPLAMALRTVSEAIEGCHLPRELGLDYSSDYFADSSLSDEATKVSEARSNALMLIEEELSRTITGLGISSGRFQPSGEQNFRLFFDEMARRIPAYAQAEWLGSREATIKAMPILGRRDIERAPDRFLPARTEDNITIHSTSGTTGPPLRIIYDLCATALLNTRLYDLVVARCPCIVKRLVMGTVAVALVSDKTGRHTLPIVLPRLAGALWQRFTLAGDDQERERTLRALEAANPPIIYGKAWYLLQLIEYAAAASVRLTPACVLVSGDRCYGGDRARLEAYFVAPVVEAYTSSEVGLIAISSPGSIELVVDDAFVFLEVLGGDGDVRREGEGELVISSVFNWQNPFLRYRTGDFGVVEIRDDKTHSVRNVRRLAERGQVGPNHVSTERVDDVFATHGIWDARLRVRDAVGYLTWTRGHGRPRPDETTLIAALTSLLDLKSCYAREVARITRLGGKRLRYPYGIG
jgi:hypothetical protein